MISMFGSSSNPHWLILETNYIHWTPPPKSDDRQIK